MKTIICDIDGTIAKMGDRKKYLEQTPKDYDKFYDEVDQDEPIHPVINLLKILSKTYHIEFVTGRRESCKQKTLQRMNKHGIVPWAIHMRKDGDFRKDDILKQEIYKKNQFWKQIEFVIDDRKSVKAMRISLGLFVLDVNQHDEVF